MARILDDISRTFSEFLLIPQLTTRQHAPSQVSVQAPLSRFRKGVVRVNGHNLGRYWEQGPQRDLFVPGCWLVKGDNEIIVLDLELTRPAALWATGERRK